MISDVDARADDPGIDAGGVPAGARRKTARGLLAALDRWGYEERMLPAWLDYERMRPALRRFAGEGCKFIGPAGDVRLLLPDGTLGMLTLWLNGIWPVAGPVRVSYEAEVYRAVGGPWRRVRQVGAELLNVPGPAGDAEILGAALDALQVIPGLRQQSVLNDMRITRSLAELAVSGAGRGSTAVDDLLRALARGDFVALQGLLRQALSPAGAEQLWSALSFRGSVNALRDCLAGLDLDLSASEAGTALQDLEVIVRLAAPGDPAPLIDLGMVRDLGYYDGFIFQVVVAHNGVDQIVASGGRYDSLFAGFDVQVPAAGFALDLDHLTAVAGESEAAAPDYVLPAGPETAALARAWSEAQRLRGQGFRVVLNPDENREGDLSAGQ
ncbi:MAG: ATP phosphoribosyltransferase regulatory subunit [Thermaerobacterales bacterium]